MLADLGARVALGYYHNEEGAEQAVESIVAAGGRATAIRADVRQTSEVRSLVDHVTADFGPIDILINNAGSLVRRVAIRELTEELWDDVQNLNLKSAVFCAQAVAPSMIERRAGAIVNVVSIAASTGGGPGAGPYSAAKGGLVTFTKSLAKELAPYGVRVNAISPGFIDTPFHEVHSTPEMVSNFVKSIPLGRGGKPEECARVIAFLASEAASFLVGETSEVNGGQLMR